MVNYHFSELKAPGGSDEIPGDNSGMVNAVAPRVVLVTEQKILGANYALEIIAPIFHKDFDFGATEYKNDAFGIGDVYLGPLVLGWHGERWDAAAGAGVWISTGDNDEPVDAPNGYGGIMLTGGATVYLDADKTIFASALGRYEFNGKNDADFEPGDQLTVEWGLGHSFTPQLDVGLVGYSQLQITEDGGPEVLSEKFSKHSVGPEVSYFWKGLGGFVKAAYYAEFGVNAGTGPAPAGGWLRLTVVKPI